MSHMLSDEDSTDSDSGIRFKTENTRKSHSGTSFRTNQQASRNRRESYDSHQVNRSSTSRHRDRSRDRHSKDQYKRSSSKEHDRYNRSRSNEHHRYNTSRSRERVTRRSRSREHRRHSEKINKYDEDKPRDVRFSSEKNRDFETNKNKKEESRKISKREYRKESPKVYEKNSREKQTVKAEKIRKYSESSTSTIEFDTCESKNRTRQKFESHNIKSSRRDSKSSSNSENQNYGPLLPPKSDTSDSYGPVLPSKTIKHIRSPSKEKLYEYDSVLPHSIKEQKKTDCLKSDEDSEVYGPILPIKKDKNVPDNQNSLYGPKIPENLNKTKTNNIQLIKNDSNTSNDTFGPSLPPTLPKNSTENEKKILGPSLPPHLREKLQNEVDENINNEAIVVEDNLEEKSESEQSDDDMIGPVPEGHNLKKLSHKLLEERALEMRINALNPVDTAPKREEWMTALPDVHRVNLGLGPRQFRAKEGPDLSDRTSWTDTPEDKAKKTQKVETKVDIKEKAKIELIAKRDKEQEEIVKKHKKKKKRDKTLIEIHQEKLAKKKEKESGLPKERRPFDRDLDLKVNRFDEAQKKAILKKAQLLDTRFSTGESKFL